MLKTNLFSLAVMLSTGFSLMAQTSNLPLIQINALEYEGAFVIPGHPYGESNSNYCNGVIEYNSANHSLFFAGHNVHGGIAEFEIPPLVNSTTLSDLNISSNLQGFRTVLDDISNPQAINTVTGLKLYNGKLIVNGLMYYNAAANNTHTSLVIDNPSDIANSVLSGYYEMEGACHSAGWISDIPSNLQSELASTHLGGASSKNPINSRLPQGVTAFTFNPSDISGSTLDMISTTPLMDYSLLNPLYADYSTYSNPNYNISSVTAAHFTGHTKADIGAVSGSNSLWTELSAAEYGFIVPGTRTYLTIGFSGGHNSGIGYKAKQNNGNVCGGPCAYDSNDYYNYYWLWDVNDMIAVKNGTMAANDVRPYARGEFTVPFQTDLYSNTAEFHPIVGGTYNATDNLLYLTIYDGAATGKYSKNPVVVAYSIGDVFLNTDQEVSLGSDTSLCVTESLTLDITGQIDSVESVKWYKNGIQINVFYPSPYLTVTSNGLYSVVITTEDGSTYTDEISIDFINCDCNATPDIDHTIDNCIYSFSAPNAENMADGFYSYGYLWDFGDGTTSTHINPQHSFSNQGYATVTLKHFVIDENGNCCTRESSTNVLVNSECVMTCGVIPSIKSTVNTASNTQSFQSNSTILGRTAGYRWTLDGDLISTQYSVSINNDNITENQELCLTVYSIDSDHNCCEETICLTINPSSTISNKMAQSDLSMSVYPNPNSGITQVNIQDFDIDKTYKMTINDISGKTLMSQILSSQETTLNLSHYHTGLYFIHLSDGKNKNVIKLIKE